MQARRREFCLARFEFGKNKLNSPMKPDTFICRDKSNIYKMCYIFLAIHPQHLLEISISQME